MISADTFNHMIYTEQDTALSLLKEGRCQYTASSIIAAAQQGNNEIVDELRDRGCEWPDSTCLGYIEHGDLGMLIRAYERGCPLIEEALIWAAQEGQLDILKWLLNHLRLSARTRSSAIVAAQFGDHQHVAEFLK